MLKERPPAHAEILEVRLEGSHPSQGRALVAQWSPAARIQRGFRMSARVVGLLALIVTPFVVIEPFLAMFWGTAYGIFLVGLVGPALFVRYQNETATFFHVLGTCPECEKPGRLVPYLRTAFEAEFTVLCRQCGRTSRARS